jgi:hypothetical protein
MPWYGVADNLDHWTRDVIYFSSEAPARAPSPDPGSVMDVARGGRGKRTTPLWGKIFEIDSGNQLHTWGDFCLFCLDSMRSTISAKSSQLCGYKVSLSDGPWMSSYIMQCELCSDLVLTTFLESWSGGELDIASCRYGQLEIAILHGDLEQIAITE